MRTGTRNRGARGLLWAGIVLLPAALGLWSEAAPRRSAPPPRPTARVKTAGPVRKPNPRPERKLAYNHDVRPILAENCFPCHGPDSAARKAGLRLDRFDDATQVRNGRAPLVPGKPAESELVRRIQGDGPLMPPVASHKKLTPEQIRTLKTWVAQGGEYEPHWSFIPPQRPPLPAVKNAKWVRNPIDRFVLARLEAAGLTPAPEADRRTLARRLSLDLIGLPPDPAEVERFVADTSPDAYERYVDRLLASPHWGEHRGRYWLDAARYADTHGIHFDNYREMWAYRDWVVKAFNRNLPFDQFTIEQLAGDLLPNPTLDQLIATGFNRCNITTNEGGVIPEEYLVLYTRDRTETASQVWLGLTANCAVCHDHKYDPLSQREFYQLAAFFNNTTQGAMDGNIKDTPPVIPVPLEEDRPRFEQLKTELAEARAAADARRTAARADFDRWLTTAAPEAADAAIPSAGLALHLPLTEATGTDFRAVREGQPVALTATAAPGRVPGHVGAVGFQRRDGAALVVPEAGDFEKDQPFTVSAWVRLANANQTGSIVARMDEQNAHRGWDLWVEGGRVGSHIIHRWPENAVKVVSRERLQAGRWYHVSLTYNGGGNAAAVRLYLNGEPREVDVANNSLSETIRTTVPLKIGQRHTSAGLDGAAFQDVRLYSRALEAAEVAGLTRGARARWLLEQPADRRTDAQKDELFAWWLPGADDEYRKLTARVSALENEERLIRFRGTVAHISVERKEEPMAFILHRGEYDQRRDPVKAGTPAVLPPMSEELPRNRLGFAKWLLRPEHPLTARVTVNRFWQEVFGLGLVRTAGDFGVSGELPSHPELLDWLAIEFREKDWDIKQFFKLLVTSATYRQAPVVTPEKLKADPDNRLLSRGPRFRMDAEMIRDYALAASGLLVRKLGGPSVKPYQPDGVWEAVAMIGSNTRDYRRDSGESLYRRSIYTFWKRSAPPASMEILNAPNRETCVVKRERTNTPLQALVTLNDVQYVEAARVLAQRAMKEGGPGVDGRADYLARRLLARPLRPEEMAVVRRTVADLTGHYRAHRKDAVDLISYGESRPDGTLSPEDLAAWTMVVNQMMNLDEVLCK